MASVFIQVPPSGSAHWKSPVANAAALPATGNSDGDARVTLNDQSIYIWKAGTSSWIQAATPSGSTAITALTGDVSAMGPGAVPATIQAHVVTNAKLDTMPANTIKGNNTGITDSALDLTVAQVKTMLSLAGTNSGDVTLTAVGATPNANGASLSTQALTLQPANTSFPGVLTAADWNTFNSKQAAGSYITSLTGDVTGSGPGASATAVVSVGGSTASAVNAATVLVNMATSANTPNSLVLRDSNGDFSSGIITAALVGNVTGNVSGSAASFTGSLAGDVTGTQSATVIAPNVVSNSKLAQMATHTIKGNSTGGTANASDLSSAQATSILDNFVGDSGSGGTKGLVPAPAAGDAAAGKFLKANGLWVAPPDVGITQLTGDVTAGPGSGSQAATVALVGGSTASAVNTATVLANAATSANTASAIVRRDSSGNFTAGTITANLTGNASGTAANVTGVVVIANGGTNSSAALSNNRVMKSSGGAIIEAAAITAARALISDGNGIPTQSTVTSTELGYSSGVTSAIQTQLDAKLAKASNLSDVASSQTSINNISQLTTKGDILAYNGTNSSRFPVGSQNQRLIVNAGGTFGVSYADATMGLFGSGEDGALTISSGVTTLTKDTMYSTVTISGTASINTAGFKLFVSVLLDLTNAPANAINRNGVNASGTTAGTALAAAILGASTAGTSGTAGNSGPGTAGGTSTGTSPSYGNKGGFSGAGGAGVPNGGGARAGTGNSSNPITFPSFRIDLFRVSTAVQGGVGGSAGGSGGGNGSNAAGDAGSGGSGGGVVQIFARRILRVSGTTAASCIAAKGGNGSAGTTPVSANCGGGGAGGGAGGGGIYLMYESVDAGTPGTAGTTVALLDVSGGNGAAGGNGSTGGIGGGGSDSGMGGKINVICTSTGVVSSFDGLNNQVTGTVASGVTGGSGGTAAVSTVSI